MSCTSTSTSLQKDLVYFGHAEARRIRKCTRALWNRAKSMRFFAQVFEDEDAPPSALDRGRSIKMLELPLEVKGTEGQKRHLP